MKLTAKWVEGDEGHAGPGDRQAMAGKCEGYMAYYMRGWPST